MAHVRLTTWLSVLTLCSVAQAAGGHRRLAEHCQERVSFVGFSDNERTLALRTVAHCPRPDRSVDNLEIVEVLDAASGRLLAVYQNGAAWNVAHGQRSLLGRAELAFFYAPLGRALSTAAWQHTSKLGRFRARRHDFANASVRLRLERGAERKVRLTAENKALSIGTRDGAEVQFAVSARLADGSHVDVGHFRRPANVAASSTLSVYYSAQGHRLAILWQTGSCSELATYNTPLDARFASNDIGAANVLNGSAEEVETLYKTMHPNTAKIWDENVGDLF